MEEKTINITKSLNDFITKLDPTTGALGFEWFLIAVCALAAFYSSQNPPKKLFKRLGNLEEAAVRILPAVTLFIWLTISKAISIGSGITDTVYLDAVLSISGVWLVAVGMKESNMSSGQKSYILLFCIGILALFMTDHLGTVIGVLDNARVDAGTLNLSLWSILKAIFVFGLLLWTVNWGSKKLRRYLGTHRKFTPTMRELIVKGINISGFVFALIVGLNVLGIDFTALTVFSGALGIGLGFGLKNIASNLISGLILLMDKSIKPGDVISLEGQMGVITEMNARFIVLRTRDGMEMLLPNERLMTSDVVNWSYNNKNIRQKLSIGVSYDSDIEQVQRILLETARNHKRVLRAPAPKAFIKNFGDSSIDMELRYWIRDPEEGLSNVRNDLFVGIWKAFRKEKVEIPYPQMVLHRPIKFSESTEIQEPVEEEIKTEPKVKISEER